MADHLLAGELERVACNLCGEATTDLLYPAREWTGPRPEDYRCTSATFRRHGPIVRCRRCGLVYMNPRRPADVVARLYAETIDETYVKHSVGREKTFTKALALLERYHAPPGRLLDVGCCTGVFSALARERRWEVCGVEASRWAADYARTVLGLQVVEGEFTRASFGERSFDVVTMWDVLEHFADPTAALGAAHRVLAPRGFLWLTTIDIGSLAARLLGRYWWWLMEMHLYYFTRDSLTRLLRTAGFEVVETRRHTRYVTLRYLGRRIREGFGRPDGARTRSGDEPGRPWLVPVNLGDIVTIGARKAR